MHLCQIQRRIEEMAAAGEDTTSLDDEAFNMEAALDRCILRLIASCCNCDKLVRATELVKLLSLEKSVRGTIKLVTALKLPNLAERFNTILEDRFIIFILQLYTAMDAQRGHICCCFMLFVEGDKLRRSLRLKMCSFSVACLDHFVINPRLGSII